MSAETPETPDAPETPGAPADAPDAPADAPDTPGTVELFTDGACSGNPGPGGWGVVLRWRGVEKELWGGEAATTNNRMELMAAIRGLEALKAGSRAALYTDSTYVQKGITEWIERWKTNGWRTAARKKVKNEDLWRRLEAAREELDVDWHWIRGHTGHPENERADALARRGVAAARGGA